MGVFNLQIAEKLIGLLQSKQVSLQLKSIMFFACCKQARLLDSHLIEEVLESLRDNKDLVTLTKDQKFILANRYIFLDVLDKLNDKENISFIFGFLQISKHGLAMLNDMQILLRERAGVKSPKWGAVFLKQCLRYSDNYVFINICSEAIRNRWATADGLGSIANETMDFLIDSVLNETIKETAKFKILILIENIGELSEAQAEKLLQVVDRQKTGVRLKFATVKLLGKQNFLKAELSSKILPLIESYVNNTSVISEWLAGSNDASVFMVKEIADLPILLAHELAFFLKTRALLDLRSSSWTRHIMPPLWQLSRSQQPLSYMPGDLLRLSNIQFWRPLITESSSNKSVGNITWRINHAEKSNFIVNNSW